MAIPDYQSLMRPVLAASSNGEVHIGHVVNQLADQLNLTPAERSELLPSGKQTTFSNRVQWAKSYLGKAQLIEITRRGHFQITDRGRDVLKSHQTRIDNRILMQFAEFRAFKDRSTQPSEQSDQILVPVSVEQKLAPDEIMRAAHREIENTLAQDLLDRILRSPPDLFERLIVNLLLSMGYGGSRVDAGRALGRSGDDGIDGVIDQDALGLDRVYVQAKRYAPGNNIGAGAIRDFFGSLDRHKAAKGLFVTTSKFSPAAHETSSFLSKRIVFIDGDQLAQLMIRYNVGCRLEYSLEIKTVDEEFFE